MSKKIEFKVIKTNIADEDGKKVLMGGTVLLGKTLATHYKKLGYIEMPMPSFDDEPTKVDMETDNADKDADVGSASAEPEKEDSAKPATGRRRL